MPFQGKTIMMMAGGTGGHVYPALALAYALQAQGATIHWLGNGAGFEGQKIPEHGFSFHDIGVKGLRGKGMIGWMKAPFMLSRSFLRARSILKNTQADMAIGMGGFASGPGGVAAKSLRLPLVIHEQNAIMGMTNTYLAKIADKVLLADERAVKKLAKNVNYQVTGNPVREEIASIAPPDERFLQRSGKIRLLVLGGSLGAKALNELLPQALALINENDRPQVLHQVGKNWLEEAKKAYQNAGVSAQIVDFIEDMASVYSDYDWVIARSGALSVAEIATAGLSALFVPFPYAVDDHQTANAQVLLDVGAAMLIQQKDLSAQKLADVIAAQNDRSELLKRANLARTCSAAHALDKIIHAISEVLIHD